MTYQKLNLAPNQNVTIVNTNSNMDGMVATVKGVVSRDVVDYYIIELPTVTSEGFSCIMMTEACLRIS